jgi:hypothetical protein
MIQKNNTIQKTTKDESRAVSPIIGFVLIIAISATALTILQVAAVPVWNEAVESNHAQEVQKDIQSLRSGTIQVSSTGQTHAEDIELGTTYPRRFLFLNPPPSSGTISAEGDGVVELRNAVATDEETADYWDGDTKEFPTKNLVYEPNYNVINNWGSLVYETSGSVVYKQELSGQAPLTDTVLVSGRRITVGSVMGNLSRSSTVSESIDLKPVSAPSTPVSLTNGTGNLTVTVPTRLSEETWGRLLSTEMATEGGYVADYSVSNGKLSLDMLSEMNGEKLEYSLRTSKVGVGSGVAEEEGHYMTAPEGTYLSSKNVVVEVRDRYSNPVNGVEVGFESDNGQLSSNEDTTGTDGRAEVAYLGTSPTKVRASMADRESDPGFDPRTKEDVEFDVSVTDESGGDPGEINPNYPERLVLRGADRLECSTGQPQGQTVDCESRTTFENTANVTIEVVEARINFYSVDNSQAQGATQRVMPENGVLEGTSLDIGGPFEPVSMSFGPGVVSERSVRFYRNGGEYRIRDGDFHVLTLVFQSGASSVYFVAPEG